MLRFLLTWLAASLFVSSASAETLEQLWRSDYKVLWRSKQFSIDGCGPGKPIPFAQYAFVCGKDLSGFRFTGYGVLVGKAIVQGDAPRASLFLCLSSTDQPCIEGSLIPNPARTSPK